VDPRCRVARPASTAVNSRSFLKRGEVSGKTVPPVGGAV
jgi:hypothetical protein